MKNRFLLLFMMLVCCIPAYAEQTQTRKVAILETVDKEGKVSYGVRLLVRSNLALAITNTPGYEGYDRVDVASIMGEQEFQRTGMVNDSQIRKLGEMTGASDILVAEVAMVDASHIIITAKILDVESAKLQQTSYVQTSTNTKELEMGCRSLAKQLLGYDSTPTQISDTPTPTPTPTDTYNNTGTNISTQRTAWADNSVGASVSNTIPATVYRTTSTLAKQSVNVRNTPRYEGGVDFGFLVSEGVAIGFSTTHGCLINPYLYVGGGVGFDYDIAWEEAMLPIFADVRGYLPKGNFRPYVNLRLGYDPLQYGMNFGMMLGLCYKKLDIGLGFTIDGEEVYSYFAMRVGLRF